MVKYDWELKYYKGNLIATGGQFIAYTLKGKKTNYEPRFQSFKMFDTTSVVIIVLLHVTKGYLGMNYYVFEGGGVGQFYPCPNCFFVTHSYVRILFAFFELWPCMNFFFNFKALLNFFWLLPNI